MQSMHTPKKNFPILSLNLIFRLDYGLMFELCFGDMWPPLTPSPSMHPHALIHHPLRLNCGLRRHASRQPQQYTMASSRRFICPFALLNSHLCVNLHAATP